MSKWGNEISMELFRQELSKVEYFLHSVTKGKGQPEKDDPLPYEDAFVLMILPEFTRKFAEHLEYLDSTGMLDNTLAVLHDPSLDPERIDEHYTALAALLAEPFIIQWAAQHTTEVQEMVTGMYLVGTEATHASVGVTFPADFMFDIRDIQAINQMTNSGIIWISEGARRQVITGSVHTLIREALDTNLNLAETSALFKRELGSLVPGRGETYFNNLASITMNRTRNMARIFDYSRLDIYYVTWFTMGDDRVCGRCEILDGTTFTVTDVAAAMERGVEASTESELIFALPFVNSVQDGEFVLSSGSRISTMSDSDVLAQAGIVCPAHPGCRCYYDIYRA